MLFKVLYCLCVYDAALRKHNSLVEPPLSYARISPRSSLLIVKEYGK
jgi:hypothetical protein